MKLKNTLFLALNFIVFIQLSTPSQVFSQKKEKDAAVAVAGAAVGIIGTAIAAAASAEAAKEATERFMVEWVLSNKDHSNAKAFELSMISWEASKKEDLNKISVIGFSYYEGANWKNILLMVCSPGWVNEFGVDFTKVMVYEIDKAKLSKILLAYLNLCKPLDEKEIISLDNIPVMINKTKSTAPIYLIKSITNTEIEFQNKGGQNFKFKYNENLLGDDTHTIIDLNQEFKIDFNEGSLNIFFKESKELVKIRRDFLLELIKNVWFDKIPVNY